MFTKAYIRYSGESSHNLLLSGLPLVDAPTTSTYDFLLNWYLLFGIGAGVIVITMLAVFMVRYRSRGEPESAPVHKTEGWKIVLVTVLISITILTAAEYETFASFSNIEIPGQCTQTPTACVHVGLTAFQWGWDFNYTNGRVLHNNLTVPAGTVVVLTIRTKDVFHSFAIEMLAVKEDAIQGEANQLWFMIPDQGMYKNAIRCFELCGVGHAFMDANLTVVSQSTWNSWIGSR
jgi:cytochrome c oxidase subunit 2